MRVLWIVPFGALAAGSAFVFQHRDIIQHRNIAWYMNHPKERLEMEKRCQSDTAVSGGVMGFECANVRNAAAGERAKGLTEELDRLDRLVALDRMQRGR